MKRFEVGKYYENNDIFGDKIFTWQCTRINNDRATFELVCYRRKIDHGKSYKLLKAFDPCKTHARIIENKYLDIEQAYNHSKVFYLEADREAI